MSDAFEDIDAADVAWQSDVLDTVRDTGCFDGTDLAEKEFAGLSRDERGDVDELVLGLTRFISRHEFRTHLHQLGGHGGR